MKSFSPRLCVAGILFGLGLLGAARAVAGNFPQTAHADEAKLFGNWAGESICVGDNPACHDEKVIYRIAKSTEKPGMLVITMDKIVDGKPDTMAVLDFKYERDKSKLTGEFQNARYHGLWEFTVNGQTIEGTLSLLPAKTIARKVKVKKDD